MLSTDKYLFLGKNMLKKIDARTVWRNAVVTVKANSKSAHLTLNLVPTLNGDIFVEIINESCAL